MISVIVSSHNLPIFSNFSKSLEKTIGVAYEIIKIPNPGLMSICEAYNLGASKAKYDYLLFVHEDVLFHSNKWGTRLINHLDKENNGIIGLAGSNYVPASPSAWSVISCKYTFGNVNKVLEKNINQTKGANEIQSVFALDGVFMAIKKSLYKEFLFNENIKGFHGYDTDFSLRVATKYKNYIVGDILIEHFSKGHPNKVWLDNHMKIRENIHYQFQEVYDQNLEVQMFYAFLKKYFEYYDFNFKNIRTTIKFLPPKISFKNKLLILNEYLHYFVGVLK